VTDPTGQLVSTSEFARRTRLTIKALRVYDRIGLLRPIVTDPNGYRRYGVEQVRAGQLIGLLRGLGLGLADITEALGDLVAGGDRGLARLDRLLAALEKQHADHRLLIRHLQTMQQEGNDAMFSIQTRHVPARRLMSMQRRLHADETDAFVGEAKQAFAAVLDGTDGCGPFMLIFHGVVDDESDGPIEAVFGCPDTVLPTEVVGVRTEPAHDEAYTTITKAQWAYPAILAAYDAVACSAPAVARSGSRLSCREVYLAEPDALGPDDNICDVAFPLAEPSVG
jgi:DNA-binding transcriptional MerR regulator